MGGVPSWNLVPLPDVPHFLNAAKCDQGNTMCVCVCVCVCIYTPLYIFDERTFVLVYRNCSIITMIL